MRERPLDLLVFVTSWGETSETFVRREADAAMKAGNRVRVVSLRSPVPLDEPGPEVIHLSPAAVAFGAVCTATAHPIRSMNSLWAVVRASARGNTLRHLAAAVVGLAAASRISGGEVAHAQFAWLSATTAHAFSLARRVPLTIFPHAFDVFEPDKVDGYLKVKLESAAMVAVESPTMEEYLRSQYECAPVVTRIGVPEAWVTPRPRALCVPSGCTPVVLSVGMLREKKGHDDLIRAIAGTPWNLRVVGEGPERERLVGLARHLGVLSQVQLLGALPPEAVRDELDSCHVFVLASRRSSTGDQDGVPNVLIEALARCVPVVATAVSGIPDLLRGGRGVLVESEDVQGLRRAIQGLLDAPEIASQVAEAGWRHVREEYVAEQNWSKMERRIRHIVEANAETLEAGSPAHDQCPNDSSSLG